MRTPMLLATILLLTACDPSGPADSAGQGGSSTGASAETEETTDASGSSGGSGSTTADGSSGGGDSSGSGGSSEGGEMPVPTGPQLYLSLCSGCHGLEAEGTDQAYELRHPDRGLATFVIRNGREGIEFPESEMAAYGQEIFNDQQLGELFDWLDAFEQPTTGEALYADYCANCHGAQPGQGVINEDIAGEGLGDTIDKVRGGEGGTNYGNRGGYMTAFDEAVLSDAEVQAIVEWMGG